MEQLDQQQTETKLKLHTNRIKALFYSEMYGKKLFNFGLSGLKSFFSAVTQVAWGIVSLIGLNMLIVYVATVNKQTIPSIVDITFLKLETFIIEHIMIFTLIFWLFYWIVDYKELKK